MAVCRLVRCIDVSTAQAFDIGIGAEHGGDDDLVGVQPLVGQRVKEILPYIVQQGVCFGHQVGDRVGE